MYDDFLFILIRNSITMSLITLIYALITRLYLKHYVAKWRYYSWLIIVLGLIIPFRPQINIVLHESSKIAKFINKKQVMPVKISETVKSVEVINHNGVIVSWHLVLGILWMIGIIAFIVYHIIRHRNFLKTAKRWCEEIDEPQSAKILQSLQEELKISATPQLLLCSCINSPMMIGFFKPIILLPHINYSCDELAFILKHEIIHFKRRDLWYKSLVFLVTAVYWFNPIVYLMAREISVQCEMSCDEETIKDADLTNRQKYSATIISAIRNQSNVQSAFITNFYGNKKNVKNRILFIMNMKKKRLGLVIIFLLAVGVIATGITLTSIASDNSNVLSGEKTTIFKEEQNEHEMTNSSAKEGSKDIDIDGSNHKENSNINSEEIFSAQVENGVLQIKKITKEELREESIRSLDNYEVFYDENGVEKGRLLKND